jgi:3-oxoacyl-[acyl-carrier protein] reductase
MDDLMSEAEPGRIALVTGAAQGIGRAVATELYRMGSRVALVDANESLLHEVTDELGVGTGRVMAIVADVASAASIDAALSRLAERWRLPDVLVNNAALTVRRSIWEITAEEWDTVLATNLRSCLLFSQRCGLAMREAGWGRIVNLASLAGQQGGIAAGAHYAASKAGIIVMTKILAAELAASGVTVNAVAPAAIHTPAMDDMGAEIIAQLQSRIPVGRVGTADEVAGVVGYLCSDRASFVTGATVDVNGGLHMR